MDEDGVDLYDLTHAIDRPGLARAQSGDPRGKRFVLRGPALDGRSIEVVCRLEVVSKRKTGSSDYCDGRLRTRRVRVVRQCGRRLRVIENVPAHVCDRCGMKCFDGPLVEPMEELLGCARSVKRAIGVPVMHFKAASRPRRSRIAAEGTRHAGREKRGASGACACFFRA